MIGYALCGSFCTIGRAVDAMEALKAAGYDIQPIMSEHVYALDTRFQKAKDLIERVEAITGREIIHTIVDAEPLGPKMPLDALIVAPCTGNTLAKIASGITDTSVTMAVKAHLRRDRPTVIALASNDSLSQNLQNIATLLLRKEVYFVPMRQDDPVNKPHSLVADFAAIPGAVTSALEGRQERPLFL
ncbi:MAG TPA: dipicolinate synthase subunit B [Clostridiales bacterium]|nr:dipicolinate synthase subunit B [Clostridiales bacterium]